MEHKTAKDKTIMRLNRDENVVESVTKLAKEKDWKAGTIMGIGAFKDTVLAYYDLDQQAYLKKTIPEIYELVSLQGNLSQVNGEPFFHMHVVIAGRDQQCLGGHLVSAKVGVTVELIFEEIDLRMIRTENDSRVALKLLDFSYCNC